MKLSAIEVTEPEELFLLNTFVTVLSSQPPDTPLFLVGDWPRSKMFNKVSYHFELVCLKMDFDRLRSSLVAHLTSSAATRFFRDPFLPNGHGQPPARLQPASALTLRLFTHTGNKYKVSLDCLRNNSLLDDLWARDFSINALYCDLQAKRLVAFQDHHSDFSQRIIRTIRPPQATFGHHVNLFFRFIEFAVRYDLRIHPDIRAYFSSVSPRTDIFQAALDHQPNNLYSSAKKFFSKHYVGKMLALMADLDLLGFFQMDYCRPWEFGRLFVTVLPLLDLLEPMLKAEMPAELAAAYPDGVPKVFFTKARMFLIAQAMYRADPYYALSFLKVFLYNGKELAPELRRLVDEVARLAGRPPHDPRPGVHSPAYDQLKALLKSVSVDKSQWAYLLVFRVLSEAPIEELQDYSVYLHPGHL